MSKELDALKLLAIKALLELALEGDERVLRIAREKAAKGNKFAKWLLEGVERAKGVGVKE